MIKQTFSGEELKTSSKTCLIMSPLFTHQWCWWWWQWQWWW